MNMNEDYNNDNVNQVGEKKKINPVLGCLTILLVAVGGMALMAVSVMALLYFLVDAFMKSM